MKTPHTPGPWHVESDGTTVTMAGQCVIVSPAPDGASRDEAKANAQLIAASPTLLAALEYVLGRLPSGDTKSIAQVRAAIAKAKGEK